MLRKMTLLASFALILIAAQTNIASGGIVIVRPIASSVDDAEEAKSDGDLNLPNSDLEMVFDHLPTVADEEQVIGLRFIDIGIPKGSTIISASVQFSCDDNNDDYHVGDAHLIIEGDLSPNPDIFKDIDFNITSRPRTTASVEWDPPRWTSNHEEGPGERTSDISGIIQELVDQDGWVAGNAIVLIISNNPINRSVGIREAESIDGARSNIEQIPTLTIEFTAKAPMEPFPADGVVIEDTWANLGWAPGSTAATHDVYFGESFADVNDGTGEAFRGNQPSAFFAVGLGMPGDPYPGGLVPGTTYYWRIDEVEADGATIYKGAVWSFTVLPKIANTPYPPDRAQYVNADVELGWAGGLGSIMQHIYFGDNFADVNDGTGDTDKGSVARTRTTYTPGPLAKGTTYYWRIDGLAADGIRKGDIWSFRTVADIPVTDPNLIGWWKFDEGYGDTVIDSSGHGNDGTLGTDSWYWPKPSRLPGLWGGALDMTGDNYVQLPLGIIGADVGSVTMWIKTTQDTRGHIFLGSENSDSDGWGGTDDHELHVSMENTGDIELRLDTDGKPVDGNANVQTSDTVNDDTWRHVAATWAVGGDITLYVDGELIGASSHIGSTFSFTGSLRLGSGGNPARFYYGLMEDVRLFNRELSQQEVRDTMAGDPLLARSPNPGNEMTVSILEATPLTWQAGELAIEHAVYFGTDPDAVYGADESDTTGIFRGLQSATSYTPSDVEFGGGPYYWRVDEHNSDGTVSSGSVWSFTVADYLVVDNFESYNDIVAGETGSNLVWETWKDGYDNPNANGAAIGYVTGESMETANAHGGGQSAPMTFDNTTAPISESTRTFSPAQDWTQYAITMLSLFVNEPSDNVGGDVYVKINGSRVPLVDESTYPAGFNPDWVQYNVDLTAMNVSNVRTLTIGVDGANAQGTILVDDIRLYREAPDLYVVKYLAPMIEAESGIITTPFEVLSNIPGASGGQYIMAPNGGGNSSDAPAAADDGLAIYTINVPADGEYVIGLRGLRQVAGAGGDDSFWVRIPDAVLGHVPYLPPDWIRCGGVFPGNAQDVMVWDFVRDWFDGAPDVDPVVFTLTAGQHELQISRREDGTALDAIAIFALE